MARTLTALLILGLTTAASCGRQQATPPPTPPELAARWLSRTCTVDQRAELSAQVAAVGADVEPLFIEAFINGPTDEEREEVIQSVEHTWSLIQSQLAEPSLYNLDQEEIAALKSISLAEEKSQELELFEYNYRAAALAALVVTQGSAGKDLLTRTAANRDSPFGSAAADALKSIANGQR